MLELLNINLKRLGIRAGYTNAGQSGKESKVGQFNVIYEEPQYQYFIYKVLANCSSNTTQYNKKRTSVPHVIEISLCFFFRSVTPFIGGFQGHLLRICSENLFDSDKN